jgi:DNA-binding beta-propeller fold protein YncE
MKAITCSAKNVKIIIYAILSILGIIALGCGYDSAKAGEAAGRTELQSAGQNFPPVKHKIDYPVRICVDAHNLVYVTDATTKSVFILNQSLVPVGEISGFEKPLGIAVDAQGRIYVGDKDKHAVQAYSSSGKPLFVLGEDHVQMPNDMCFDANGNLYIADSLANAVFVYSGTALLRTIGSQGDAAGQFRFPVAVSIQNTSSRTGSNGKIYVADQGHSTIQVFDTEGNFIQSFGGRSGMSPEDWQGKFARLQSLCFDDRGRLFAMDCYMNMIQILDSGTGAFINSFGSFGTSAGQMDLPLDMGFAADGRLIISNSGNHRVEYIALPANMGK